MRVDAEGLVGWGEAPALPEPTYTAEYAAGAAAVLADHLVPRWFRTQRERPAGDLLERIDRAFADIEGHRMARSGLITALPVAQLGIPSFVASLAGWLIYRGLLLLVTEATDTVKVNYRGTFPDGKEFDSSYKGGKPIEFPLNRVIKCWTEGVQRMKVGGKARLTCPAAIAYGSQGAGGVIPPNATLLFEVELLGINGK